MITLSHILEIANRGNDEHTKGKGEPDGFGEEMQIPREPMQYVYRSAGTNQPTIGKGNIRTQTNRKRNYSIQERSGRYCRQADQRDSLAQGPAAGRENIILKRELAESQSYGTIIGDSYPIKTVISQIELVAPTDANVLIHGESGTGKELVARVIHRHSQRKDKPMVKVNCATIPKELYESEFFGHAKGAFTGAVKDRIGRFEAADGGTIFLDEVGEIPLDLQSKLLRILQEGEYERVGEEKTRRVDVRIIAATNKKLLKEVRANRFRDDLFYRLNVFPIEIDPLRERKDDIQLLATHFVDKLSKKLNVPGPPLTKANVLDLQSYDWPGNVRELKMR